MQVVEIGNIGHHNDWIPEDDRIPEVGIIIQASREELQGLRLGDILYREVEIRPKEDVDAL